MVIILLGLLFGITVPNFREAMVTGGLDSAAMNIIGLVRSLRETAISNQVAYRLHIDIREKKFWTYQAGASQEDMETAREKGIDSMSGET